MSVLVTSANAGRVVIDLPAHGIHYVWTGIGQTQVVSHADLPYVEPFFDGFSLESAVVTDDDLTVGGNLDVPGTTLLGDNVILNGNLDHNGNSDISGTLAVHGAVTLSSTVACSSTLAVTGMLTAKRVKVNGTTLVAGDFALSGSWGTTAAAGTVSGCDQAFVLTVTSGGTGQGANPTITLTFKDGTFTTAPKAAIVMHNGGNDQTTVQPTWTLTATQLIITLPATPLDTKTYTFMGIVLA